MPKNKPGPFALRAAYVEFLHDRVVAELWPGSDPVDARQYRDRRLLESAVARPWHTAFGEDIYKGIPAKAAALFHSLIANHPFQDGNKRTAVIALDYFLLANEYFLTVERDELYQLAMETASYKERRVSHQESLERVAGTVERLAVAFAILRSQIREQDWESRSLYDCAMQVRREIRRHKLNRPQPFAKRG